MACGRGLKTAREELRGRKPEKHDACQVGLGLRRFKLPFLHQNFLKLLNLVCVPQVFSSNVVHFYGATYPQQTTNDETLHTRGTRGSAYASSARNCRLQTVPCPSQQRICRNIVFLLHNIERESNSHWRKKTRTTNRNYKNIAKKEKNTMKPLNLSFFLKNLPFAFLTRGLRGSSDNFFFNSEIALWRSSCASLLLNTDWYIMAFEKTTDGAACPAFTPDFQMCGRSALSCDGHRRILSPPCLIEDEGFWKRKVLQLSWNPNTVSINT